MTDNDAFVSWIAVEISHVFKYSRIVTPYIMFPCTVCLKVFKKYFLLRHHTKTYIVHALPQSATIIMSNLQTMSLPIFHFHQRNERQ